MTYVPAPPDEQFAVRVLDAIARHRRIADVAGWSVAVAPGGSTDRTFQIFDRIGEPRLTVRLARPGLAQRLFVEARILQELAEDIPITTCGPAGADGLPVDTTQAGRSWTPRDISVIEVEDMPERWLLVHEHMPGRPESLADISVAARENLGACLAWLHSHRSDAFTIWPALERQEGTRADSFHRRIDTLRRYQSAHGQLPEAMTMIEQLSQAELPSSAGWHERDFALCHGDVSVGNLLWDDDDLALIDWEFARDGDPAEDIAYLAAEQDLPPELIADIAESYVAADGDPWAFARLPVWLPLVALDAALWWADYHLSLGEEPGDQRDVIARLDRARRYM